MRKDKGRAFDLRRSGKSYKEICQELGMSKSTLSNWFRDVNFSKAIKSHLAQQAIEQSTVRIKELNKKRGAVLDAYYEQAHSEAISEMKKHKHDPLFISAIVAYWGEGDKLTRGYVRITNTDPLMLALFMKFLLEICALPVEKIKGAMFIYQDLDEKTCRAYWSNEVGIRHFHKTMVLPSRHKERRLPYGICSLVVSSTYLKEKMRVWIDQLPKVILNGNLRKSADIV